MKLLHSRPPFNFCGADSDFKKSKVVVLPVPYDSTASYKSGTRGGPAAIIDASRNMEFYDIESGVEIASKIGIYTLDELEPNMNSPREMIDWVRDAVREIIGNGKFPVIFGGEHSITVGAVEALKEKIGDVSVLQIDAHADLRDEYEGTCYSHACVMRRIREIAPAVQVGIRSMSLGEKKYIDKEGIGKSIFGAHFEPERVVSKLGKNVYITIDVDGFDPSEVPSVGTPEPGGLRWEQVLGLLKKVAEKKNVVGFDIVELRPTGESVGSEFLCAKLAYKLIGYVFRK